MNASIFPKSPQPIRSMNSNPGSSSLLKAITNILKTIPKFFIKGTFKCIIAVFNLIASVIFLLVFLVSGR